MSSFCGPFQTVTPGSGGGGGNPFDQDLNTTDSPTFVDIRLSGRSETEILYASVGGVVNSDPKFTFFESSDDFAFGDAANTSPAGKMHANFNSGIGLISENNTTGTGGLNFLGRKSRGSFASPAAISAGDVITSLAGEGYATSSWGNTANLRLEAAEAYTSTNQGNRWIFSVFANGTNFPLKDAMLLDQDQVGYISAGLTVGSTFFAANTPPTNGILAEGNIIGGTEFADNANTSITPVLGDANTLIRTTAASAVTFTVPTNASVAYPTGTSIAVTQSGAGTVTFSPAGGVTINSFASQLDTAGQYASAVLTKVATDTWDLTGNIA